MSKDPLNLDDVAYECIGRAVIWPDGLLIGLGKLKEAYEKIEYPQKSVREVANHSSVILDLQLEELSSNKGAYLGIKNLVSGKTRTLIGKGKKTLKNDGKNMGYGVYEYKNNTFIIYKKFLAERENLFIKVSDEK